MRKILVAAALLFLFQMPLAARAGSAVSVRLVEASNSPGGDGGGLEDVLEILQQNLPYKFYKLVEKADVSLPAQDTATNLGDLTVSCSGKQESLKIVVRRKNRVALNTTVNLKDKKPLILGGFPTAKGKLVLVFVAR